MFTPAPPTLALGGTAPAAARQSAWLGWVQLLAATASLFAIADTIVDPDLWGHLTFGRDILHTGRVRQEDRYSCTSDRPWINHEWLAETLFAGVYRLAGPPGLVALKTCLGAVMLGLGFRLWRRLNMPKLAAALFLLAVALALRPGMGSVRPQVYTYLLFALALLVLRAGSRGKPWVLLALAPLFAAWANLHGGFLAGVAVVELWCLAELASIVRPRPPGEGSGTRLTAIVLALAAPLAVLANPYGPDLVRFLLTTATVPRPEISEWAPLRPWSIAGLAYATLLAGSLWAWTRSQAPRRPSLALVHAATALAPLLAVRHLPLFGLATMILAADHVADASRYALLRVASGNPPARWLTSAVAGTALLMACLGLRAFRGVRIDARQFDFPAQAVEILQRERAEGRMLVDFDWGEFVIWHLGPGLKVSIDGRRETVYSPLALRLEDDFRTGRPGWRELLSRARPVLALLRAGGVPETLLRAEPGWRVAYEDGHCTLLARTDEPLHDRLADHSPPAPGHDGTGRWLPWPPPSWGADKLDWPPKLTRR